MVDPARVTIFHLLSQDDWKLFQSQGTYLPPSLASDGFIHCSSVERVAEVANAFYQGQSDLVLLEIDPEGLTARLVYEPAVDRPGKFPHIYGPLNLDAVLTAQEYPPDDAGRFHGVHD